MKARCDYGIFLGASSQNASQIPKIASSAFALKMYLDTTFTTLKLDDFGGNAQSRYLYLHPQYGKITLANGLKMPQYAAILRGPIWLLPFFSLTYMTAQFTFVISQEKTKLKL
jgi:hypothetical protein